MSWLTDMGDVQLLDVLAEVRSMQDVTPDEKELTLANLHQEFHRRGLAIPAGSPREPITLTSGGES